MITFIVCLSNNKVSKIQSNGSGFRVSNLHLMFLIFLHLALFGSWLARTDPKDVARVESKTVIVTKSQRDTIPIPAGGVKSQLGSWMSESDWQKAREERFPGCMAGTLLEIQCLYPVAGRTCYVSSFSNNFEFIIH